MRLPLFLLFCLLTAQLSAQLVDDFSDGDFSQNPSWIGDNALFQISPDLRLQSDGLSQSDTIALSTPSSRVGDTEWRLDIDYGFAPSTSNQIRVYLVSDVVDVKGPLNGYFLQVGESQSMDSYDLYRQDGTSTTKLIDGTAGSAGSSINATVRILRDGVGNWSLEVDSAKLGTFVPQGSIFDDTYTSSTSFGVWVKHSSGRAKSYFFDNVYVGDEIVDTEPPVFQELSFLSPVELYLAFDEPLQTSAAEETTNYLLQPGNQVPFLAQQSPTDLSEVTLQFGIPLAEGTTFQLIYNGLADLSGNVMAGPDTVEFLFDLPDTAAFKDVLIHEIMADPTPSVGLPETEYLELYNRSAKTLDLQGWSLSNGSTVGTLPTFSLSPDAYVILVREDKINEFAGFGSVIGIPSMPTLTNGGDELGLRSIEGLLIDSVEYEASWYGDPDKDDGGYSLELIWPEQLFCPPASNWGAAVNGGTPGAANSRFDPTPDQTAPILLEAQAITSRMLQLCFDESMEESSLLNTSLYSLSPGLGNPSEANVIGTAVECVQLTWSQDLVPGTIYTLTVDQVLDCSGNALSLSEKQVAIGVAPSPFDIVITELFPDFSPPITLPQAEFVEIFNRTSQVVDITQFSLSDGSSSGSLGNQVLFPGEYAILCREDEASLFQAYGKVISLSSWPSLNNTNDSVLLRDENLQVIDWLAFTDEWYRDEEKSDGGWTLERIDPDFVDCNQPENWRASLNIAGGTPGSSNSVLGTFVDTKSPGLRDWEIVGDSELLLLFDEPMDAATLEDVANYLLQPTLGNPESIDLTPGNESALLRFSTALDSSLIYELSLSRLADCSSNLLDTSITIGVPILPAPFEVIFSEILSDESPPVALPEAEFIELYVRSDRLINLEGYQLTDGSSISTFPATALLPNNFYILCSERDAADLSSFGKVLPLRSFPSLNTSSDSLLLLNPDGELIEYLFYEAEWLGEGEKADGGWTLERVDQEFVDCNQPGNWEASIDPAGGTPGKANSIAGTFVDNEIPEVIAVRVLSANEIELEFSEQMDEASLENLQLFQVDQGIGNPILTLPEAPHFRQLTLILDTDLQVRNLYELEILGLTDCSGNSLQTTVSLGLSELPEAGDVLINEILFNPYSGASDFVEIVNVSDKVLDFADLGIAELDPVSGELFNGDALSNDRKLFFPGELICLSKDVLLQQEIYLPPPDAQFLEMRDFPSYDDARGECVLFVRQDSLKLDVFSYEDDFHFATLADDEGVSLERLSLLRPTQDPDNWHSAASTVGFATPGYENSQQAAVENPSEEVSLSPQTFSPNQDGQDDILAINYTFDFPGANARVSILDSRGRLVKVLHQNTLLASGSGTFYWDGTDDRANRAPIGTYIVLFEVVKTDEGRKEIFRKVCVLADRL